MMTSARPNESRVRTPGSGEHGDRLHVVRTVLRAAVPSETVERVNGATNNPKGGSGMDRSARRYRCSQDRQPHALAVPHSSPEAGSLTPVRGSVSGPSASYAVAEGPETGGAPGWSLSNRERKAAHVAAPGETKWCNVAGAVRKLDAPATWTVPGEFKDASARREEVMSVTPPSLATATEELIVEFEARQRRAWADGQLTHAEGVELFKFWSSDLAPQLTVIASTVHVIGGMVRSGQGVDAPNVQRTMRERWQRLGLIVPFRKRRGGDLPPAA